MLEEQRRQQAESQNSQNYDLMNSRNSLPYSGSIMSSDPNNQSPVSSNENSYPEMEN